MKGVVVIQNKDNEKLMIVDRGDGTLCIAKDESRFVIDKNILFNLLREQGIWHDHKS